MPITLAEALDILGQSDRSGQRERAMRRVCEALHAWAEGDADRQEAAQVVAVRLAAGRPRPQVVRTEAQAHAYLKQALRNAWLDEVRRAQRHRAVDPADLDGVAAPAAAPERDLTDLHAALDRLDRGEVPRVLAARARDRSALLRGIGLRARQIRALLEGQGRPRLSVADDRASRRAADVLRRVYSPSDPVPADAWIGRLAWLDLRTEGLRSGA